MLSSKSKKYLKAFSQCRCAKLGATFSTEHLRRSQEKFLSRLKLQKSNQGAARQYSEEKEQAKDKDQGQDQDQEQEQAPKINLFDQLQFDAKKTPNNLIVRNLLYPATGAHIVLLGVQRRNALHASYVADFLEYLKPDWVFCEISPDLPQFIRTQEGYDHAWRNFVRGQFSYKFYVNPQPSSLADVTLSHEYISPMFSGSLLAAQQECELRGNFLYTHNHLSDSFEVDTLYTPLAHAYNNSERKYPITIGGFPALKHRMCLAEDLSVQNLQNVFSQLLQQRLQGNLHYDPCILHPHEFLLPKITYMTALLQHITHSAQKILAVTTSDTAHLLEEAWPRLGKKLLPIRVTEPDIAQRYSGQLGQLQRPSFIEYIEKHVLLDFILDPIVRRHFVELKSFPFFPKHTVGYFAMLNSIFVIWEHYFRQYQSGVIKVKPKSKEIIEGDELMDTPASQPMFN